MDPSRKDRITRKISNTMHMLIEKSRNAAAQDCRKVKNKQQVFTNYLLDNKKIEAIFHKLLENIFRLRLFFII